MDPKVFINIILALLIGCLSAYVAKKRGRDTTLWFVLGAFFQFLALIVLLLLPPTASQEGQNKQNAEDKGPDLAKKDETLTKVYAGVAQIAEKIPEKSWFYLDKEHKQYGPVPLSSLKELLKGEQLSKESYVWQEGMKGWKRLSELPYLTALLQD